MRGEKREKERKCEREREKESIYKLLLSLPSLYSFPAVYAVDHIWEEMMRKGEHSKHAFPRLVKEDQAIGVACDRCQRQPLNECCVLDDYHLPAVCDNIKEALGFEAKKIVGTGVMK